MTGLLSHIDSVSFALGGLFAGAFFLSLILVPLVRRVCIRIGFVDNPGERKIHAHPVSYGGGVAIYLSFITVVILVFLILYFKPAYGIFPSVSEELLPFIHGLELRSTIIKVMSLLGGGTVIFLLGLIDDKYKLRPTLKLMVQILCAVLIYCGGIRVTFFIDIPVVKVLLTVLWIVGITNAFNLLDNMDGLSSGVAFIAGIIFLIIAAMAGQILLAGLLCVFCGAVLGFIPYNFFPAKIFMGDSGSLFLGFMLGAVSISGTYYSEGKAVISAIMPVIVLCIPIFDTLSVMIIRWKNGKPLMVGDKNHFSHRLNWIGMTRRESVLTIYLLSATLGLSALMLFFTSNFGGLLVLLHTMGVLVVIALLEVASSRNKS